MNEWHEQNRRATDFTGSYKLYQMNSLVVGEESGQEIEHDIN